MPCVLHQMDLRTLQGFFQAFLQAVISIISICNWLWNILCRVLLIDNHGMHPHKFQVLLQALTQDILPLQRLIVQFPAASSLLITYCAFPTAFILIREILAMLQDFLQAIDPSMPTVNCGVSCCFHLKSLAMSAKIWNHCWFHWWFKAGSKISGHSSNS